LLKTRLNLVTIRSPDIDRAVRFYEALGLRFSKHAHGTGPEHYCSEDAGVAFEIYPLGAGKTPTTDTRLGFAVSSVDEATAKLSMFGAQVISAPTESAWGRRAVLADFDGHRVELISATESVL
jgi:lactoylglutathione lyase